MAQPLKVVSSHPASPLRLDVSACSPGLFYRPEGTTTEGFEAGSAYLGTYLRTQGGICGTCTYEAALAISSRSIIPLSKHHHRVISRIAAQRTQPLPHLTGNRISRWQGNTSSASRSAGPLSSLASASTSKYSSSLYSTPATPQGIPRTRSKRCGMLRDEW